MRDKRNELKEQYLRSAERESREGNEIRATMYRNEAWLVDHPEGWLEYIQSEGTR